MQDAFTLGFCVCQGGPSMSALCRWIHKVHSSAEADAAGHLKLLLDARLSGACGVSKHLEQLDLF